MSDYYSLGEYDDVEDNYSEDQSWQEEAYFEKVIEQFSELIEDYGTAEVFKHLPDDVVFDIVQHLGDAAR